MLRMFLMALVVYLSYRLFKGLGVQEKHKEKVKGNQKSKPLDLRNLDVEDAHFEDIKDSER